MLYNMQGGARSDEKSANFFLKKIKNNNSCYYHQNGRKWRKQGRKNQTNH